MVQPEDEYFLNIFAREKKKKTNDVARLNARFVYAYAYSCG